MLTNVISGTKKFLFKGVRVIQKFSPEICLAVSVGAGIAALYFTREGAKNEDAVIENFEKERGEIKYHEEMDDLTHKEAGKELGKLYIKTCGRVAKVYWKAILFETIAIGSSFGGYTIQKNRIAGLTAVANGLTSTINLMESRTNKSKDEQSTDETLDEKNDISEELEGNCGKGQRDPNGYSMYAKFFDEYNVNWCKNPESNLQFLKFVQSTCNDRLQSRGFLFLNEVYQALGIPMTSYGQMVGWVLGNGDDFVDFGIMDGERERARAFVNGREASILLDFNVDGVIWDKI